MLFVDSFSSNFSKSNRRWLPLLGKAPRKIKHLKFLMSLYHVLIVHKYFKHIKIKSQNVWRKNLLRFGFYEKTSEVEVIIPTPHLLHRVNKVPAKQDILI